MSDGAKKRRSFGQEFRRNALGMGAIILIYAVIRVCIDGVQLAFQSDFLIEIGALLLIALVGAAGIPLAETWRKNLKD
jgi:hypothetical protein